MKKLLTILLALAMIFALVGCSTEGPSTSDGGEETAKAKIGAILPSLSFDFQVNMKNGIERAAAEKGYEAVAYDYNFDNETMLSDLDLMVNDNVKGLYAIFLSGEVATPWMQEHADVGVLTQGAPIEGGQAYTVNDYVALGKQFVESLENYCAETGLSEGKVVGLWLETCEDKDNDYYQAMLEIKAEIDGFIAANPGFEYVADFFPSDDEETSNDVAQALNQFGATVYFAFNNGYAIAAANEISSADSDASKYFVFSSEGDDETFRLIASGTSPLRGCAFADIEESGYQVGLQLINWIENGVLDNVTVAKVLVDSRNVSEYTK